MSRALQPELHPDAESLNAFIEQALPREERAGILGHLATCARCRQIVFLAQQAGAEEPAQEAAREAAAPPRWAGRFHGWTRDWRLAWAPAAAFALLAAIAVSVHLWHVPGDGEVARVAPPAPLAAPASRAVPEPISPPPAAAHAARNTATAPHGATTPRLTASSASGDLVSAAAAPPPRVEPAESSAKSIAFGREAPASQAASASAPAVAAWQSERAQAELSHASRAMRAERARSAASTGALQSAPNLADESASTAHFATKSLTPEGFEPAPASAAAGNVSLTAAQPATVLLPSGLAVLSSAALGKRTVAIDRAGSLYMKARPDGNWVPVTRQWTGRLIQVRVQTPAQAESAAAPTAVGVFAIVNSGNQVWTSPDGKTWKAQ